MLAAFIEFDPAQLPLGQADTGAGAAYGGSDAGGVKFPRLHLWVVTGLMVARCAFAPSPFLRIVGRMQQGLW
jgi:hypothetical protein